MFNYDKDRNLILKSFFFKEDLEYSMSDLFSAYQQLKNLYPDLDDSEIYIVIDEVRESLSFEFWVTPSSQELKDIEENNKLNESNLHANIINDLSYYYNTCPSELNEILQNEIYKLR